jgi:hypothetical protein
MRSQQLKRIKKEATVRGSSVEANEVWSLLMARKTKERTPTGTLEKIRLAIL